MGNTLQNIFTMADATPDDLSQALINRYSSLIPENIDSSNDIEMMGNLLGKLANEKTFLYSCLCYLKTRARTEKNKGKENKQVAEEMAMRRDAVDIMLEAVKGQYDAVSRMLTARKMKTDELYMLGEKQTSGYRK